MEQLPGLPEQRERTIAALSEGFVHGILGLEEFERRVELAHGTDSSRELEKLLADLPAELRSSGGRILPDGEQPLFGIMSTRTLRGDWLKARRVSGALLMSTLALDFRDLALPAGVIELNMFTAMASLQVTVPEGLPVELDMIPIMANCRLARGVRTRIPPSGPGLRMRGLAVMSEVTVRVR